MLEKFTEKIVILCSEFLSIKAQEEFCYSVKVLSKALKCNFIEVDTDFEGWVDCISDHGNNGTRITLKILNIRGPRE
jgi:hypothetical protein